MPLKRSCRLIVLFYIVTIILSRALVLLAEVSPDLSLIVKADKEIYRLGEDIAIDISLKNTGDKPLALFHPDTIHKSWFDWHLNGTVIRPDSIKLGLEPEIFYSMIYSTEKKHFITLAPGEEINVPVSFLLEKDKEKLTPEGEWIATIELDEDECRSRTKDIKKKYNIKGDTYTISGSGQHLALKDILMDVFNIEGEYVLEILYDNRVKYYSVLDEEKKYFVGEEYPDAWTGALSATITIVIEK